MPGQHGYIPSTPNQGAFYMHGSPSYTNVPYQHNGNMHGPSSGFTGFRKRFERVDWRKMAIVDVDRISRELDFDALQDNIMNITFCSIESELDPSRTDPNFIKLFKLAQLTIEYLLYSQEFLSSSLMTFEEKLQKSLEEHKETKKLLEIQKEEIAGIKKESHKRKKLLAAQQQLFQSGSDNYHQCPVCSKAFMNITFLRNHMQRRHNDGATSMQMPETAEPSTNKSKMLNTALEKELHEIRHRLYQTESQLQDERNNRQSISARERSEQSVRDEKHRMELEQMREEQLQSHKDEMDRMKDMFMREIKELSVKYDATHRALSEAQQTGFAGKLSNLGTLKDDYDVEDVIQQYRHEVAELKEQSKQQLEDESLMWESKLKDMDNKYLNELKKIRKQHSHEMTKANTALENLTKSVLETKEIQDDNSNTDHLKQIHELRKQLKEQERHRKDQEKKLRDQSSMMAEMSKRPPVTAPRKPPLSPQPDRTSSASPPKPLRQNAEKQTTLRSSLKRSLDTDKVEQPISEESEPEVDVDKKPAGESEEDDSESSDLQISDLDKSGTGTLGSTSRDLTLTTNTLRLIREMKNNPDVLRRLKDNLKHLLDQNLQDRGIRPQSNTNGLSDKLYKNKMEMLKHERQPKAKKYPNFYDIRQQYIVEVDKLAKKRLRGEDIRGSLGTSNMYASGPKSQSGNKGTVISSKGTAKKSSPPSTISRPAVKVPKLDQPKFIPQPAPRPGGSQKNSTLLSTGSPVQETTGSSQWSSDEEGDSALLDDEDVIQDEPTKNTQPPIREPVLIPKSNSQSKPAIQDEESESWDSEEISELDESEKKPPAPPSKSPSRPMGAIVSERKSQIEAQLMARSGTSKPVGGVDTMRTDEMEHGMSPVTPDIPQMDDDDDIFSSESLPPTPPENNNTKTKDSRKTYGDTDLSSNTYGTSQWGSSSKAASTVNPNTHGSTGTAKSSLVSVTDWDSDDED